MVQEHEGVLEEEAQDVSAGGRARQSVVVWTCSHSCHPGLQLCHDSVDRPASMATDPDAHTQLALALTQLGGQL